MRVVAGRLTGQARFHNECAQVLADHEVTLKERAGFLSGLFFYHEKLEFGLNGSFWWLKLFLVGIKPTKGVNVV